MTCHLFVFTRGEKHVAMVVGLVVLDFACGSSGIVSLERRQDLRLASKVLPCRQGLQLVVRLWLCF